MSKKSQICDVYIENLRQRAELTVGPELIHEVRKHFESLPTLYAIEVNTEGLDVLVSARRGGTGCRARPAGPPRRRGLEPGLPGLHPISRPAPTTPSDGRRAPAFCVQNHKQLLDSARQNPMSVCFQASVT